MRLFYGLPRVYTLVLTYRAGLAVGGVVTVGRAAGTLQHLDALLHEDGVGPDPDE